MNLTESMRLMLNQLNESESDFTLLIRAAYETVSQGVYDDDGINRLLDFLELLEIYPDWKAKHEAAKNKISHVYRGLGFGEGVSPEYRLKPNDIKRKVKALNKRKAGHGATGILSTSFNKTVAWKFVHQSGTGFDDSDIYNEDDPNINSDYGFLISYKINPASVLMVVDVFEPYFHLVQLYNPEMNENEVIIDSSKAQLTDIEYFAKSDQEYEWDSRYEDDEDDEDDTNRDWRTNKADRKDGTVPLPKKLQR